MVSLFSLISNKRAHAPAVLTSTQAEVRQNKGKDYEIAKWEDEIRKSLASKKSTPVTLSKQQLALVQAQLEKEAKVRAHVNTVQQHLVRGLNFVKSLVAAGVEEFQAHMSAVVSLLLKGALSRGSFLAGSTAFETYIVGSLSYHQLFQQRLILMSGSLYHHVGPPGDVQAVDRHCDAALPEDRICS